MAAALLLAWIDTGPRPAAASPANDFYVNQALDRYFVLPRDAETLSLGGAAGAVCRSANCLYLNPAGLGTLGASELAGTVGLSTDTGADFFSDGDLERDTLLGFTTAALRLGGDGPAPPRLGTLGVGYSRYDGDAAGIDRAAPDGHRRSLAYGIDFGRAVALGYSFHWYDDQLRSQVADLHSTSRLLHTWGAQIDLPWDVRGGGLFKLGIGKSDTEDFRLGSDGLSRLREYAGVVGAEKRHGPWRAIASFDYARVETRGNLAAASPTVVIGGSEEGDVYTLRAGVERTVWGDLRLRAGFVQLVVERYEFGRPDLAALGGSVRGPGFTAGAGLLLGRLTEGGGRLRLDYGFEYLAVGNGSWEHLLSVAVPVGL